MGDSSFSMEKVGYLGSSQTEVDIVALVKKMNEFIGQQREYVYQTDASEEQLGRLEQQAVVIYQILASLQIKHRTIEPTINREEKEIVQLTEGLAEESLVFKESSNKVDVRNDSTLELKTMLDKHAEKAEERLKDFSAQIDRLELLEQKIEKLFTRQKGTDHKNKNPLKEWIEEGNDSSEPIDEDHWFSNLSESSTVYEMASEDELPIDEEHWFSNFSESSAVYEMDDEDEFPEVEHDESVDIEEDDDQSFPFSIEEEDDDEGWFANSINMSNQSKYLLSLNTSSKKTKKNKPSIQREKDIPIKREKANTTNISESEQSVHPPVTSISEKLSTAQPKTEEVTSQETKNDTDNKVVSFFKKLSQI
ncbi:hypothetical protein [Halobacillus seohaensis]|uniref:Uncharacterized protein n=1 Tax=Halobacillus seohaensis TaxID=447421 RepID=A0ABW2ETU0_9BACI